MNITFGDTNLLTLDEADSLSIQDIAFFSSQDPSTAYELCLERHENRVLIAGPMSVLVWVNHSESPTVNFSYQLTSARKYEEGLVDIGFLHEKLRIVAEEWDGGSLSVEGEDDAPAFYNTYINGQMKASETDSLADVFKALELQMKAIYREATIQAARKHLGLLEQLFIEQITEKKHES